MQKGHSIVFYLRTDTLETTGHLHIAPAMFNGLVWILPVMGKAPHPTPPQEAAHS